MANDSLRGLVGTSSTKIGTFLFEFATPGIGQILKAAGADFAVLDMEHTGFGFDTVRQVVRYMQAANLPLVPGVPLPASALFLLGGLGAFGGLRLRKNRPVSA